MRQDLALSGGFALFGLTMLAVDLGLFQFLYAKVAIGRPIGSQRR